MTDELSKEQDLQNLVLDPDLKRLEDLLTAFNLKS